MIVRVAAAAAFAAALLSASTASAGLIYDYELNGSLADSTGLHSDITNLAGPGSLGATGITFGAGAGPTVGDFSSGGTYTVATRFNFDDVNGYRRIADFLGGTSDTGLYVLNGALNFYNITTGAPGAFTSGTSAQVVFTRDGVTNLFAGYVNGVQQISFTDSGSLGVLTSPLRFFRDDNVVGGEHSAGFVDYVRIYDTALSGEDVARLTDDPPGGNAVPEPTTWALMVVGFGALGAGLRRRRAALAIA